MSKIAFVTCAAHRDGFDDDRIAAPLVSAEFRVWDDQGVDWTAYDRVVVRSVWDYTGRVDEFLAWAESVGPGRLRNTPALLRFNADKRYLTQLDAPTVPTTLLEPGVPLPSYEGEIVVKPNVSAGARDTGRFEADAAGQARKLVERIHASGRIALVQPYLPGVDSEGEQAVVFFGGRVSHALHKNPVLRESGIAPVAAIAHGPAAIMLEPDLVVPGRATDAELRLARRVHDEVSQRFGQPLFARIDMVPGPDGEPVVIELEAIDANFYFELIPGAAQRFADAIAAS